MDFIYYILTGKFKRINVVGCPGAGKSSVAKIISETTGYPLFDLDNLFYNRGCKRKSHTETLSEIDKILIKEYFIIDGTYTSSFEHRLGGLDLVVFIDKPTITCIYRFFKRLFAGNNLKCGESVDALQLETEKDNSFNTWVTRIFEYKVKYGGDVG